MSENENHMIEALADAMDTLVFVSFAPSETRVAPLDLVLSTITYAGCLRGRLCLIAPASLGCHVAANVLGIESDDPQAQERAADSLRELMNVMCGAFCAKRAPSGKVELGLPQSMKLETDNAWEQAVSRDGTHVFNAEGHTIAVWMEESE